MKKLYLLLFFGLFIRLSFIYFQYSGDVKNHIVWAASALQEPFLFYSRQFAGFNAPNYPPLTIYLFSFSWLFFLITKQIINFLNSSFPLFPSNLVFLFETTNMQAAFLKLPAILADLGIGVLIYHLTSRSLLKTSLYLFNPAVIYISAVWGQIESIPIFFILLALFIFKRHYYLSHLSFTLAFLSKQTAFWLLPVFLIIWFKNNNFKKAFLGVLLQALVFIAFYFPFTHNLYSGLNLYLSTLAGSSNLVADAAWNVWFFLIGAHTPDTFIRPFSIIILLVIIAYLIFRLWRHFSFQLVYSSLFWLALATFFLQTRVHERHLAPAIPLLLLFPVNKKIIYFVFILLSSYHMFNLYYSLRLPFI